MPPKKKTPSTSRTPKKTTTRKASTRTASLKALAAAKANEPRRAIFIDVENTSSEEALLAALNDLGFDQVTETMQLVAVGNWRVIGAHVARMLAQRGARLVHTAPATGVKDWSDLSIAVAAGIWLGRARPGDRIEIISADRAFDAVGDASAALGVHYRRVAYGPAIARDELPGERRRSRRGGRRRRRPEGPPTPRTRTAAPAQPPRTTPVEDVRAETQNGEAVSEKDLRAAPPEAIVDAIARLTERNPERGVNLDLLISALKAEGYGRPPGSPRLVTRLRMLKDVEVSPTGMVRLVPGAVLMPLPREEPAPRRDETPNDEVPAKASSTEASPKPRRSRRRGGRGRRRSSSAGAESPHAPGNEHPA